MPKYSAPVAVADVLVVFGTATMNSAAVGNGIGNVAVRDEQYPHCLPSYSEQPRRLRSVPAIIIIPITKSVINISVAYAIDESFTVIW